MIRRRKTIRKSLPATKRAHLHLLSDGGISQSEITLSPVATAGRPKRVSCHVRGGRDLKFLRSPRHATSRSSVLSLAEITAQTCSGRLVRIDSFLALATLSPQPVHRSPLAGKHLSPPSDFSLSLSFTIAWVLRASHSFHLSWFFPSSATDGFSRASF